MTTRKDFLAAGTGAAALAALTTVAKAAPAAVTPASSGFTFDQAGFATIVGKAAKHKLGFGAKEPSDADVADVMNVVVNVWQNDLGVADSDIHAVGIFYHVGAVLAFNDALWNELFPHREKLAMLAKTFASTKAGAGNPYKAQLSALEKRGASFLVCNNAVTGIAHAIAHFEGKNPSETAKRFRASLIPGSLVVPAGVWAIGAIQEAGFTYQRVS